MYYDGPVLVLVLVLLLLVLVLVPGTLVGPTSTGTGFWYSV